MDTDIKIVLRKYIIFHVLRFSLIISVIWLVIDFGFVYIFDIKILEGTGLKGLLTIILISLGLSYIIAIIKLAQYLKDFKNNIRDDFKKGHEEILNSLVCEIEDSFNKKNWEDVIKLGSVLSRPLWTTGRYKLRIRIGKFVEQAAAYAGHPKEQAQALIDDLGWTNFELSNVEEAKKNIEHGIKISEQNHIHVLAYKGYRHLSGIFLSQNNIEDAEKNLEMSYRVLNGLSDGYEKKLSEAGYLVNKAIIFEKKNEIPMAIELIDKAQDMYRKLDDKDREVKLFHFKGDFLFKAKEFSKAKDIYRKGLAESLKYSRRDGIYRNTIGIALIEEEEGDFTEAIKMFTESSNIAQSLGFTDKVLFCNNKIENINKKFYK